MLLLQDSPTFHIGVRIGDSSVSTAALTSYTPEACTQTATKATTAKAAMGLLRDSQPWKPVAAALASSSVVVLVLDAGLGFRPASWSALCFSAFNSTTPGAVGAAKQRLLLSFQKLRYSGRKKGASNQGLQSRGCKTGSLALQNSSYCCHLRSRAAVGASSSYCCHLRSHAAVGAKQGLQNSSRCCHFRT